MESKSLVVLLLLSIFQISLACDGWKIRIISVKNCGGDDQVIKISPNSTVQLTKNCEVVPHSCVETTGFKTASVKYKISKNGIPMLQGGPEDLCKQLEGSGGQIQAILDMFGMPKQCPMDKQAVCADGDKKVDIKKHKAFLGMARGKILAHADIVHDTGKTCLEIELEVKK